MLPGQAHDQRERGGSLYACYDMGVEFEAGDPAVAAGLMKPCACVWPEEELPLFEARMREYRAEVEALGRKLFVAFAIALDLPENYFDAMIDKPFGPLRINYYPPQDPMTENDDLGIHAHTDFQCFTFLAQNEVEGLQVLNGKGEWITAPPVAGTYVVNIGDQMARWTNDIFTSTMHRVLNVSGQERMSVPLFFGASFTAPIDTLPTCISPERPKKYEPVMADQHVLTRFGEAYTRKMF
jgi:isopenicillin N synthase-like dioxygenase